MKFEMPDIGVCPKGYGEEQIADIMQKRALFILGEYKKCAKRK